MPRRGWVTLALLLVGLTGCEDPPQPGRVPRAAPERARWLGVAVGPSSQDYARSLEDAVAAGMEVFEIPQQWNEVGSPENSATLEALSELLTAQGVRVALTINPLDTLEDRIPQDLRGTPFDAPEFLARYLQAVDAVLAALADVELVSVAIGNEVDVLLGADPARWARYTTFVRGVKAHLAQVLPHTPVGVKLTYGAFQTRRAEVDALVAACDLVQLTYYPVDEGQVRDPAGLRAELGEVLAAYPDKPLHLAEVGFPASPRLRSSPAAQAEFVGELFAVWDDTPRLRLVNVVWLNDLAPAAHEALVAAHGAEAPLVAFLATLGLRDSMGRPKPAFERLRAEAAARGFGAQPRRR